MQLIIIVKLARSLTGAPAFFHRTADKFGFVGHTPWPFQLLTGPTPLR